MRQAGVAIASLILLLMMPVNAEIVRPTLSPPPCSGTHCVRSAQGARLQPPGASGRQKVRCPAGTVYNPSRGTCKVVAHQN